MESWEITADRYVAFFDIMGFKNLVFRNDHGEVLNLMSFLRSLLDEMAEFYKEHDSEVTVKAVTFSDSILLISSDNSAESFDEIIFFSEFIMRGSFERAIPLKGAIACGKQTADFNNSIHFGIPLIDAYLLQEELFFYGIVVHDTVEKILTGDVLRGELLRCYKAPFKSGRINHYVIDWREYHKEDVEAKNWMPVLGNLYKTVSGSPRIYVDNTIEYFKWLEDNHERSSGK